MVIIKVHATQGTREGKKFCIYSHSVDENVNLGDIVKLEYESKNYYFEIIDIQTSYLANSIDFIANEIGYYNLLSKRKIDIRKIINKKIKIVTDEEILKQIQKERYYC